MAINTELFIETIKKFPVIYDRNNPDFKDMFVKQQAWVDVAEIMEEDREVLKLKWRSLRQSYRTHLRACQPTAPGASRRPGNKVWPWAKHLEFMKPFTKAEGEEEPVIEEEQPQKSASASPQNQHLTEFINTRPDPIEPNSTQPSTESRLSDFDETDLIFLGYARILKRMSALRQASTRYQMAQVLMQAEVDQANEDSGAAPHIKNSPRTYATESEG